MLTFCKGRLVSPKAICSSPVGLTGVLFKALFEFFSSAHVHSKLNLLFWGEKKQRGEKDLRSSGCASKHPTVYLNSLSWHYSHLSQSSDTCCCTLASIPKGFQRFILNFKTPRWDQPTMKVWPPRPPWCDISLCQKIKEGKEERQGKVLWGFPPPSVQSGDTGVSLKMVRGTQIPGRAGHKS